MNPSETFFGMVISVRQEMKDIVAKIFLRNDHLVYNFITEVEDLPTEKVIYVIEELDKTFQKMIKLIQDLIKIIDVIVNKDEKTFWNSQKKQITPLLQPI